MKRSRLFIAIAVLGAALALGAVACGDDEDEGEEATPTTAVETPEATQPAGETPEAGVVNVNLTEFILSADPASVTAGSVTFNASNIGGADHQLHILRTDLAPDALPTNEDGSADETGEGIEVVGEIPDFAPGGEESLTVDLEAGAYVLICNVVDTTGSHYELGMLSAFEVTG